MVCVDRTLKSIFCTSCLQRPKRPIDFRNRSQYTLAIFLDLKLIIVSLIGGN